MPASAEDPRGRQSAGDNVVKKVRKILVLAGVGLAAMGLFLSGGCGGSSSANVVTVTVTSSEGTILILGQTTTLTATVTGATNTGVNWQGCTYTTTTVTGTTTTTSKPVNCPTDGSFGTLSNEQTTGTATYLAPSQLPDQTKFPSLQLIFTAQSQQNTAKTGSVTIRLNSGISVVLNTTSSTVPTEEQQQFFVTLTNDLQSKHVTWLVTQNIPTTTGTTTTNYPQLPSCSPSCGIVVADPNNPNVAVYTAPMTVPTSITPAQTNNTNAPSQVTIVATSVADNTRFAAGTITIVAGGPITFNGISPTIAPQGAVYWDIFLDAPNISSASQITLTDSNGGTNVKLSGSGQIKVLFAIPIITTTTTNGVTTTTVTNPNSTGARLRLNSSDLNTTGPFRVSVTDPGQPVTAPNPASAYTFTVIPVRTTAIASVPDDIVQGALTQSTQVIIDGGYFGPSGSLANVFFQGNANIQDPNNPSTARQLITLLPTSGINANSPGLYPLSVARTVAPLPSLDNPAVTNIAIFPNFSSNPPLVLTGAGLPVAAGTNPSAIDIDPTLDVLVVAETGSNAVQFYTSGTGALTPIDSSGAACGVACPVAVGKVPTGLSVNRTNHTVAVVNYQDQSVTVLPLPGAPAALGTPFTVDISGALQHSVTPAPLPYSIGVDPDSNLALVAYSSTSTSSAANLGFIVNLNPNTADANGNATNPYGCGLGKAISSASNQFGQCLFSQVTLNTGGYPQIAMSPHGHRALVTPGGSGVVRGVDVTKPSSANVIISSTLTAGLVTVSIDTTKCPPGVAPPAGSTDCPLGLVPGNAGSVLIAGMTPGNSANSGLFNGVFPVSVTSSTSFTYAVNSTLSDTASGGTVFYGTPDQIFPISATAQGVAINPITNTAAIADVNATGNNGSQIDLLNSLDQSVTSITFHATCTVFTSNCSNGAELLGTADVAWQPYTNALVSYNPQLNQVSVSDPVSQRRYAFACQTATAPAPCLTNPATPTDQQNFLSQITLSGTGFATLTVQNGTTNSLNLFGGLAVDPATNQAFVLKSGSGSIDIVNLGPTSANAIKPTQISGLLVPSPTPGLGVIGGLPNALVPQATLTCTPTPPALPASCDLAGVQIFGSGFASGAQVRLDGVDITTKGGSITRIAANGREIDVTIPSFFLSAPHHYSVDVVSSGAPSNSSEFIVIQAVDMSKICAGTNSQPSSVAIADQIANGPFSPIAVVSNSGCNSISIVDINPSNATFGTLIGNPITVGTTPQGIAISQRYGLAIVANNGSGTASIVDLTKNPPAPKVPDVSTGTNPTGVAINDATGAAVIANTGSNTVSMLNFGSLFPPAGTAPPTTLTPVSIRGIQQPISVAVDPDRGTNNQGIAVVTAVQLNNGAAPNGVLAVVEIGLAIPSLSTTISSGIVTATPTGIVFDPVAFTNTANQGLFYANSSGSNVITAFNPDSGGGNSVNVGINPTSLALNPQTGAILTANSASNTISIVDTLSNPFKTRQTLGIPGSPTFGVAIDQFTNLAVIVDQAHQRVLLFPMPN